MTIASLAQPIIGAALVAAAWLLPRRIAGARLVPGPQLLLDAAIWFVGAALLMIATGRPLFTGFVVITLSAGFALADHTMRQTLREPVVFCTVSEFPQLFTHPHLYLPFAGPGLVIGGAAAGLAAATCLLLLEPPPVQPEPFAALAMLAFLIALCVLIVREPLLGVTARLLRRLNPTDDPEADAATLGPFGMLFVHGVIARAERTARQRLLAAPAILRVGAGPAAPVVIVQCESFFDARRVSPLVPADLLPGFDACCGAAAQFGRLQVPGWGANTMRSEFAVLTGIPESDLGYDRFNPYFALARVPLASQVWRMRRAGYRTICLHPFDRRFFRRDRVLGLAQHRIDDGTAEPMRGKVDALRRRAAAGPDHVIAVRLVKAEILEGRREARQVIAVKRQPALTAALLETFGQDLQHPVGAAHAIEIAQQLVALR